ncbi:MAG: hypothetical protein WD207_06180, partial [Xanthobacteraceae bacterium]
WAHPVPGIGPLGTFAMSYGFAALVIAGLALAAPARAETQIFVVNGSDGYGVDRCLAAGERCGEAAATALCRARQYAQAVNYGRVDQSEITGANAAGTRVVHCEGAGCPETVAITCSR